MSNNQFAVALSNETGMARFGETKSGKFKEGSLARAIVFMNRQERMSAGQALYAKWLSAGQFRPIVEDVLACGLIAKAAVPIVRSMAGLNESGPVSKEVLIRLCQAVVTSVDTSGKAEPKATSDKGFVLTLCREVAKGAQPSEIIDQE